MMRAIVMLLALLLPCPASGFHYVTPQLLQVTPVEPGAGNIGTARWAGLRYVVFDSDAALLGGGTTGRQVYLFDLQERDLQGGPALYQLTSGPGDYQRATGSKNGRLVVYDGQPGGEGSRQLFLFDRRTDNVYQLTDGEGDSLNARMDDVGRTIVFESSADFFNSSLTEPQIYAIDLRKLNTGCPYPCATTGHAGLRRITDSGSNRNAVTSNGGKVIAFETTPPGGETQIYVFDSRTGTTKALSQGPGASRNPSISRNGAQIAFESDTDPSGTQIYVRKRKRDVPEQITHAPIGHSTLPSMSTTGRALAFVSSDDLLDNGSSGPQVFSYDIRKHILTQVTSIEGTVAEPAYASGVFVTFISNGDLLGNGSTGPALFLVNLYALGGATAP